MCIFKVKQNNKDLSVGKWLVPRKQDVAHNKGVVIAVGSEPINEVKEEYKKPNRYIGSGINGVEVKKMLQGFLCRYKNGYIAHEIGSAVEYLLRAPFKNGIDDIRKAGYIITRLIDDIDSDTVPWEYKGD